MASQEEDKAMAGLLRRSLARDASAAAGEECPAPDILAAFYERSMDAAEIARYERHFSQCAHCREQLAAMVRAQEEQQREPSWAWVGSWRLLLPATVALLVGAFLYSNVSQKLSRPADRAKEVTMTQPPAESPADSPTALNSAPASPEPAASLKDKPGNAVAPASRALPLVAQNNAKGLPEASTGRNAVAIPMQSAKQDDQIRAGDVGKLNPRVMGTPESKASGAAAGSVGGIAPAPAASPAETNNGVQVAENRNEPTADTLSATASSAVEIVPKKEKQATGLVGNFSTRDKSVTLAKAAAVSPATVIKTPDPGVRYRIAGLGLVERTRDGGATWQGQQVNAGAQLVAGAAPSPNVCWLVGHSGIILLTKDGAHWAKLQSPVENDLVGIAATDAKSATVTASDGQKFSTADGGRTWNPEQ